MSTDGGIFDFVCCACACTNVLPAAPECRQCGASRAESPLVAQGRVFASDLASKLLLIAVHAPPPVRALVQRVNHWCSEPTVALPFDGEFPPCFSGDTVDFNFLIAVAHGQPPTVIASSCVLLDPAVIDAESVVKGTYCGKVRTSVDARRRHAVEAESTGDVYVFELSELRRDGLELVAGDGLKFTVGARGVAMNLVPDRTHMRGTICSLDLGTQTGLVLPASSGSNFDDALSFHVRDLRGLLVGSQLVGTTVCFHAGTNANARLRARRKAINMHPVHEACGAAAAPVAGASVISASVSGALSSDNAIARVSVTAAPVVGVYASDASVADTSAADASAADAAAATLGTVSKTLATIAPSANITRTSSTSDAQIVGLAPFQPLLHALQHRGFTAYSTLGLLPAIAAARADMNKAANLSWDASVRALCECPLLEALLEFSYDRDARSRSPTRLRRRPIACVRLKSGSISTDSVDLIPAVASHSFSSLSGAATSAFSDEAATFVSTAQYTFPFETVAAATAVAIDTDTTVTSSSSTTNATSTAVAAVNASVAAASAASELNADFNDDPFDLRLLEISVPRNPATAATNAGAASPSGSLQLHMAAVEAARGARPHEERVWSSAPDDWQHEVQDVLRRGDFGTSREGYSWVCGSYHPFDESALIEFKVCHLVCAFAIFDCVFSLLLLRSLIGFPPSSNDTHTSHTRRTLHHRFMFRIWAHTVHTSATTRSATLRCGASSQASGCRS